MGIEDRAKINTSQLLAYAKVKTEDTSTKSKDVQKAPVITNKDDSAGKTNAFNLANKRWSVDNANITYHVAPRNYYYGNGLPDQRPTGTRPGGETDGSTHDDLDNIIEDLISFDRNPSSNVNGYGKPGKVERALAQISREYQCDTAQAKKIFKDLVMKYNVVKNGISSDAAMLMAGDRIDIPLDVNGEINIHPDKNPPLPSDGTVSRFTTTISHPVTVGGKNVGMYGGFHANVSGLKYNGKPVTGMQVWVPEEPQYADQTRVLLILAGEKPIALTGKDAIYYLSNTRLQVKGYKGYEATLTALDIATRKEGSVAGTPEGLVFDRGFKHPTHQFTTKLLPTGYAKQDRSISMANAYDNYLNSDIYLAYMSQHKETPGLNWSR